MKQLTSGVLFPRLVAVALLVLSISSCSLNQIGGNIWGPAPQVAADPNKILFTRDKAIETHFQGRALAVVEGVWVWSNNQYEVAIFRNNKTPETPLYREYDFIGVLTDSNVPNWRRGDVKLLLKETASSAVYSGTYFMGDGSTQGTAFILNSPNLLEASVQGRPYGVLEKVLLLRVYPKGGQESSSRSSSGSGFFVSPDIVATNFHVVSDANEIGLQVGELKIKAEILVQDRQNDLALLKVKPLDDQIASAAFRSSIKCLSITSAENSKSGQAVFVLGFPMRGTLGSAVSVSQGIINSTMGINNDPTMVQISVPIQPGNSGSPLLDDKGQVIGVVTSTLNNQFFLQTRGVVPQNVNFAVKAAYLKTLLAMIPSSACNTPNPPSGRPLDATRTRELLGASVVMI